MRDFTRVQPRPLISTEADLAIQWSPKSACTQVLIWHLYREGLLPAANYFHRWPHNFRNKVYYHAATHTRRRAELIEAGGEGWTLLRVVRDPAKRFVSSYRHSLRHALLENTEAFSSSGAKKVNYSITEFAEILKKLFFTTDDPVDLHVGAQAHPIGGWDFARVMTINVDEMDLYDGLNAVTRELAMGDEVDFATIPDLAGTSTGRHSVEAQEVPDDLLNHPFTRKEANGPFPNKALAALPEVQRWTETLYPEDAALASAPFLTAPTAA